MDDKIKVLIIEDNLIFQTGTSFLIQKSENFEIAGIADDGKDASFYYKKDPADVVLMDIHLPKVSGIEATQILTSTFPNVKILACSTERDDAIIVEMVKAGALGFVYKGAAGDEMLTALRTVANGITYFSKEMFEMLVKNIQSPLAKVNRPNKFSSEDLSERELEILYLITNEMTNKEIAERLYISPRTVDTHRRNLLQKLNVKNTAGLVRFYLTNNQEKLSMSQPN